MTDADQREDGRVLRARALREERRAQILAAAHRVFASKGYHAATIGDIIKAAGIARGTFYLYFESKRSLFEEILDDLLRQLREAIRGVVLESEQSPTEQLRATLLRILAVLVENEDMTAILLRQAVGLDDDFDNKLAEFYGRVVEITQVALDIGMEIGFVREMNTKVVARCILGSVKEVLAASFIDGGLTSIDMDALSHQIIDYNLRGVVKT